MLFLKELRYDQYLITFFFEDKISNSFSFKIKSWCFCSIKWKNADMKYGNEKRFWFGLFVSCEQVFWMIILETLNWKQQKNTN